MGIKLILRTVYLLALFIVPFLNHELVFHWMFVAISLLACFLAPRLFALLLLPLLSGLSVYTTFYSSHHDLMFAFSLCTAYLATLPSLDRYSDRTVSAELRSSFWELAPGVSTYLSILLLILSLIAALSRGVPLPLGLVSLFIAVSIVWRNRHFFPKPSRREFAQNTALLLVSVLICLVFLEVASARLFWYSPQQSKVFKYNPHTCFASRPGYRGKVPYMTHSSTERRFVDVKINRQGLRESYEVGPKSEMEFRILLLGDSFSFGYSLEAEECIDATLERLLNDSPGLKRVEVLNAGVSGFSPWQMHAWLIHHGPALKPDIILIQSFATNDVAESLFRSDPVILRHLPVFDERLLHMAIRYRLCSHWQMRVDTFFNDNFHFYHSLKTLFKRPYLTLDILNGTRLVPQLPLPSFPVSLPKEFWSEGDLKEWYPTLKEAWKLYTEDILNIAKTSKEAGIPLLLFDIPFPFEHEEYDEHILAKFEPDKLNRLVEQFFRDSRLDHVPLLEMIRAYPDPAALYYHWNSHLTPEGVEYIAQPIAEKIRELKKLP